MAPFPLKFVTINLANMNNCTLFLGDNRSSAVNVGHTDIVLTTAFFLYPTLPTTVHCAKILYCLKIFKNLKLFNVSYSRKA